MEGNAITTAIILFLIVADVCNASSFLKLRYLADETPTKNDTTATPPPSSPLPNPLSGSGAKKLDTKPDTPAKLDSNLLNKTDSVPPPPDDEKVPKPSDKPEKVLPSGNSSSLASNLENDKTMEDNAEKKRNMIVEKIQTVRRLRREPEQRRIRIIRRRRHMGMKVIPSQGLWNRVLE